MPVRSTHILPSLEISAQTVGTNNFCLQDAVHLTTPITVLTGLNGSGKSRFLRSLNDSKSKILIEGEPLADNGAKLLTDKDLIGVNQLHFNKEHFEHQTTLLMHIYAEYKMGVPITDGYRDPAGHRIDRSQFYDLIQYIAEKTNSDPMLLDDDALSAYSNILDSEIFSHIQLSAISNIYIRNRNNNKYREYQAKKDPTESIAYVEEDEYEATFGRQPWVVFNEILEKIFAGKFKVAVPDEKSRKMDYIASLRENGRQIDVDSLSDGEKALYWIAITTFNTYWKNQSSGISQRLLLLDEPDARLHPKMVKQLYAALHAFWSEYRIYSVITTHSPTTVALSGDNHVYTVGGNQVLRTQLDEAVSLLLDGVPQISIDPSNRRQVFVEALDDAVVYQAIFDYMRNRAAQIHPAISLNFVPVGMKLPLDWVSHAVKTSFPQADPVKISAVHEHLGGHGDCQTVYGMVEALSKNGNTKARGLVDWDRHNLDEVGVTVLGRAEFYAIENWVLDPMAIQFCLWDRHKDRFDLSPGHKGLSYSEWARSPDLQQKTVDAFVGALYGRESRRDTPVRYVSGLTILGDSEYLLEDGHRLETQISAKYPELRGFVHYRKSRSLKEAVLNAFFIDRTEGHFIPMAVLEALAELQR